MQWSIGYKPTKYNDSGDSITRAVVVEASPVILGASPNTRTTKVDAAQDEQDTFVGLAQLVGAGIITRDEARERAGFEVAMPEPEVKQDEQSLDAGDEGAETAQVEAILNKYRRQE